MRDIFFEVINGLGVIGEKEIPLLFDRNAIARYANNFIKMLKHLYTGFGQSRHGRLCKLGPEKHSADAGVVNVERPSRISTKTTSNPALESQKAVAVPTIPPPITTTSVLPKSGPAGVKIFPIFSDLLAVAVKKRPGIQTFILPESCNHLYRNSTKVFKAF